MNNTINQALTQETPGKIMGLLGAALFSMAFLFAVSSTNASLSGSEITVRDPFSMANVVASIDGAANSYSNFLTANLFAPAQETFALYGDNIKWLADNSGVTYALGFADTSTVNAVPMGRVAGASVVNYHPSGGVVNVIYNALTQ